ncbi:MAG TPA: glycosyltransferase family 87 protein [Isosphaeraceae bacterium]|nr:glycosyltransferase family 87 protein [Isosphaeraceae bacterium]
MKASPILRALAAHWWTLLAALLLAGFAVPFALRKNSEWETVYVAAARHLWAGEDIYTSNYLYPPFMAWLTIPFTVLPPLADRLAFYALNVVCLLAFVRWSWQLASVPKGDGALGPRSTGEFTRTELAIGALGLLVALPFALDCLTHQQNDLLLAALLLGGCRLLSVQRPMLAATLFGLAAGIKCTPLLWAPYLALRGRWRAALWVPCVALAVNLLPNLVSTPEQGGMWLGTWVARYLKPMGTAAAYPGVWGSEIIYNHSLSGLANRMLVVDWTGTGANFQVVERSAPLSPVQVKLLLYGVELALVLGAWIVMRRSRVARTGYPPALPAEPLEYCIVLLLMLLLSPMSSKPHFCTLFLPGFCLARLAVQQRDRVVATLLVSALVAAMLANKDLWGDTIYTFTLWHGCVTWSALLLLAAAGYWLITGANSPARPPILSPLPELLDSPMAPSRG